jgi:hypothetical protein
MSKEQLSRKGPTVLEARRRLTESDVMRRLKQWRCRGRVGADHCGEARAIVAARRDREH